MPVRQTKHRSRRAPKQPRVLGHHLAELQARLFGVAVAFIVLSSLAYQFHDQIVWAILAPIDHEKLVYLTPGGGFSFIFQTILWAAFLVTAPILIAQLYQFIKPALPEKARASSLRMIVASALLMFGGAAFGYFVAIPSALQFLMAFAGDFVTPNLTADSYLSFVVAYMIGLGLLFQLPLLLVIGNWVSPIPPGKLLTTQQYVIVIAFILAAIITPTPDPVNQAMVALPVIGVYQIGVISVFLTNKKLSRKAPARQLAAQQLSLDASSIAEPKRAVEAPALSSISPVITSAQRASSSRSLDGFSLAARPRPAQIRAPSRSQQVIRSQARRDTQVQDRTTIDGIFVAKSA